MTNKTLYKLALILTIYLVSGMVYAKTIKVAVIDTGYDFKSTWTTANKVGLTVPKLCDNGHYDFTDNTSLANDSQGHGTHIASLIAKDNQHENYCLIILKYYDPIDTRENITLSNKALAKAIELNVDIINFSGGGNSYMKKECDLVKKALNKGIKVVTAAGNESNDLNKKPYYPAMCDNRVYKIVNVDTNGNLHNTSNYGNNIKNLYKEVGVRVLGLDKDDSYAMLTGTSQSTAVFTNKLIKRILNDARTIRSN